MLEIENLAGKLVMLFLLGISLVDLGTKLGCLEFFTKGHVDRTPVVASCMIMIKQSISHTF